MNAANIRLRPAEPIREEGRAFARYLDQAAEGFFGLMLGKRSEDILATAYLERGHDLSFEHVTFAERDSRMVGMISGYTADQHRASSLRPVEQAAGGLRLRMRLVTLVFAPLLHIIDTISDEDFYLQAIAIDPDLRGTGIGSTLIDWIEEQARDSGATRLALDVAAKNEGARRLYERRGMTIESQWPKNIPLPSLTLYRMSKEL